MECGPLDLSGRTALVTGSGQGIGRAIAGLFAAHGARVALHDLAMPQAQAAVAEILQRGGVAAPFAGDFAQGGEASGLATAVMARFDAVDIVVLNASMQIRRSFAALSEAEFAVQVQVNLQSTWALLQALLPGMAARGWGRVLTIGSVQQVRPNPELSLYAALKSAQANLARNLAKQHAGAGITVNNLAPGLIDTGRNADLKADPARYDAFVANIPAQRPGTVLDCAWPALLLCSDAGAYITGADLPVDGGLQLP